MSSLASHFLSQPWRPIGLGRVYSWGISPTVRNCSCRLDMQLQLRTVGDIPQEYTLPSPIGRHGCDRKCTILIFSTDLTEEQVKDILSTAGTVTKFRLMMNPGILLVVVRPIDTDLAAHDFVIVEVAHRRGGGIGVRPQHGRYRYQVPVDDEPRDRQAQRLWIRRFCGRRIWGYGILLVVVRPIDTDLAAHDFVIVEVAHRRGGPKGYGFADFADADAAASAVRNLNDHEVMGRKIRGERGQRR
jgi:RNA recognition motif-containing protein